MNEPDWICYLQSLCYSYIPAVCKWGKQRSGCRGTNFTATASCSSAHNLFNFKVLQSHTHIYKQRYNLRHTQLHLTAQTYKQIKPPSVSHTHKEPNLHSYADRNHHHPPLLFSGKFTGLINRFYIVNMADCVWYTVSSTHNSRLSIWQ